MSVRCELARLVSCCVFVAALLAAARPVCGETEPAGKTAFQVDVELFSVQTTYEDPAGAARGAESYRSHGSGSAGPGGSVSLAVSLREQLRVTVVHKRKAGCHVAVKVDPQKPDRIWQPQSHDFDLSDLEPASLRVGPWIPGGQALIVNLIPSIRRPEAPAPLDADALGITRWAFHGSPVIVNGWHYAGEMNMAGGERGYVDLPGLAKVEFSLKPFRGAEPTGLFQNGTITLSREAPGARRHTIEIRNVRTGSPVRIELGSRPYQVWARWSEPSQSLDEAIAEVLAFDLEEHLADLECEAAERERLVKRSRWIDQQLRRVDPKDLSYDDPLAVAREALGLRAGMGPIRNAGGAEGP